MVNVYLIAVLSFIVTFVLFIPFIDLLYKLKIQDPFRKAHRKDRFGQVTDVFDQIKAHKSGTPTGGGILIVLVVLSLFSLLYFISWVDLSFSRYIIFILGFVLFGLIGFYDDAKKVFKLKDLALRVRHKFAIQLGFAFLITYWGMKYGLFFVDLPFVSGNPFCCYLLFGVSVLTIIFMSNAFNIIDGIDGLSSGSLLITLLPFAFFIINGTKATADLVLVYLLFGATLAYLYFNIKPARLFMGDTGALAIGAVLGILVMTTGTFWLLPIYGLVYIVDASTSLIQWTSLYFRNRKVFKIAPIHHHFEAIGWEDTKVVFRFWLAQAFFALLSVGLFSLFV
jgi:phospho-N-acetylmuramoyl-pentapeptide-transferase